MIRYLPKSLLIGRKNPRSYALVRISLVPSISCPCVSHSSLQKQVFRNFSSSSDSCHPESISTGHNPAILAATHGDLVFLTKYFGTTPLNEVENAVFQKCVKKAEFHALWEVVRHLGVHGMDNKILNAQSRNVVLACVARSPYPEKAVEWIIRLIRGYDFIHPLFLADMCKYLLIRCRRDPHFARKDEALVLQVVDTIITFKLMYQYEAVFTTLLRHCAFTLNHSLAVDILKLHSSFFAFKPVDLFECGLQACHGTSSVLPTERLHTLPISAVKNLKEVLQLMSDAGHPRHTMSLAVHVHLQDYEGGLQVIKDSFKIQMRPGKAVLMKYFSALSRILDLQRRVHLTEAAVYAMLKMDPLDLVSWSSAIEYFRAAGLEGRAHRVIPDMIHFGLEPFIINYKVLLGIDNVRLTHPSVIPTVLDLNAQGKLKGLTMLLSTVCALQELKASNIAEKLFFENFPDLVESVENTVEDYRLNSAFGSTSFSTFSEVAKQKQMVEGEAVAPWRWLPTPPEPGSEREVRCVLDIPHQAVQLTVLKLVAELLVHHFYESKAHVALRQRLQAMLSPTTLTLASQASGLICMVPFSKNKRSMPESVALKLNQQIRDASMGVTTIMHRNLALRLLEGLRDENMQLKLFKIMTAEQNKIARANTSTYDRKVKFLRSCRQPVVDIDIVKFSLSRCSLLVEEWLADRTDMGAYASVKVLGLHGLSILANSMFHETMSESEVAGHSQLSRQLFSILTQAGVDVPHATAAMIALSIVTAVKGQRGAVANYDFIPDYLEAIRSTQPDITPLCYTKSVFTMAQQIIYNINRLKGKIDAGGSSVKRLGALLETNYKYLHVLWSLRRGNPEVASRYTAELMEACMFLDRYEDATFMFEDLLYKRDYQSKNALKDLDIWKTYLICVKKCAERQCHDRKEVFFVADESGPSEEADSPESMTERWESDAVSGIDSAIVNLSKQNFFITVTFSLRFLKLLHEFNYEEFSVRLLSCMVDQIHEVHHSPDWTEYLRRPSAIEELQLLYSTVEEISESLRSENGYADKATRGLLADKLDEQIKQFKMYADMAP